MNAGVDVADLARPGAARIVLLVADGLGGYPHPDTGLSELEAAATPNLDALAAEGACGLTVPVAPGITPGSGPGHLALFGYDPVAHQVGRGVMEALGIGLGLAADDAAARGNFCSLDGSGAVVDRRAGRLSDAAGAGLASLLDGMESPAGPVLVRHVRGHRFVAVFPGAGTGAEASDTDPGEAGLAPLASRPLADGSDGLAGAVNAFADRAARALAGREAQGVLLRGISAPTCLPSFPDRYRLRPAAIAAYPMYRGLAQMAGMEVLDAGGDFESELAALDRAFAAGGHDFFFLHYKPADAAGEDGDFDAKVAALEELDASIPRVLGLGPDVLVVAGDHATPAVVAGHSWHPVPLVVRSRLTRGDGAPAFSERAFRTGSLGTVSPTSVMTLAMAHAGRLAKYGP